MIVVRNVFKLKFGQAKDAVAVFKEGVKLAQQLGFGSAKPRLFTDLVSDFYTVVLEHTFESLSDFENSGKTTMGKKEWQAWYQKVVPFIESGHREIFTVVE